MTYYPTSVKTFTTKADYTSTVLAEHVNSLQDEVNAVEFYLGTYITTSSGWVGTFDTATTTWNTLKDRISNLEYGVYQAFIGTIPSGGGSGQVLVKNTGASYDVAWSSAGSLLPSQTGNNGKYLSTNGSAVSWVTEESSVNLMLLMGS